MQLGGTNWYARSKFLPKKFEQLISAQGWNVIWNRSILCACYQDYVGQPDPNCPICRGKGYIYTNPASVKISEERATVTGSYTLTVRNSILKLNRVLYNSIGQELKVALVENNVITLVDPIPSIAGILIDYEYSIIKSYSEDIIISSANLKELIPKYKTIQVINSLVDKETGTDVQFSYFTLDFVQLLLNSEAGRVLTLTYEYIEPIQMIITSATESKKFMPMGEIIDGDVSLTFMWYYDIGNRDRITVLDKNVYTRNNELLIKGTYDRVKNDNNINILQITSLAGGTFQKGIDYVLEGANTIKWIGDAHPGEGETYSVLYTTRREYIIWQETPQQRHTGEVLLPSRVMARKIEKINYFRDSSFENS